MVPTASAVPGWLANLAAVGWRILVVAGLAVVAWWVASVLWTVTASIAVAVVVSAVFAPGVLRLRAQGRSRTAAATIVWVLAIGIIGLTALLLVLAFLPYAQELLSRMLAGVSAIQERLAELGFPSIVQVLVGDVAEGLRSTAGAAVGGIVAGAASVVTILILATFLVFFFLRDGDKAWVWAFQALGDSKREGITAAGDDALQRVGGYLRGTAILSAIIALTDLLFLLLLGIPLAVPLAVLAFVAGFIPYFGGAVASIVMLLVAAASGGIGTAVLLLVLMGARSVFLGYAVRPVIYGRTVDIHPALVLVALPAGYQVAGVIGLFAAVPTVAVVLAVAGATRAILEPDEPPELPALVPGWLDRVAQWSWRLLVVTGLIVLAVAVFVAIPLVLVPVALGLVLAATLEPSVRALVSRGWPVGRAAAVLVGGGSVLVIAVLAMTTLVLIDQAPQVGAVVTEGAQEVSTSTGGHLDLPALAVAQGAASAVRAIVDVGRSLASAGVVALLSVLLAFYFLRDGSRLWGRLTARVVPDVAPRVDAAGRRAVEVLGGYMIGTAAISFVGAASQLVIMVVLDLPLALPVFVLSFILCFIPYIGGFISTGIAFLIAVAAGSTVDVVVMGVWTIVFNLVQGNIVSPIVYGRTVHLHPAIVLVAIPAAAAVAGMLGMFIVVPALGVVAVTWRTVLSLLDRRAIALGELASQVRPAPDRWIPADGD